MSQQIHLKPADVPAHLRHGYAGRKLKLEISESVSIPADAGTWDEGSREVYRAIRLSDGAEIPLSDQVTAPWDPARKNRVVKLEPGLAVVRRHWFLGRDGGLTFYLHSADAAPLLPPKQELTQAELWVLNYCGFTRAQREQELAQQGISAAEGMAARAALIERGLLSKTGAITTAGRNARGG